MTEADPHDVHEAWLAAEEVLDEGEFDRHARAVLEKAERHLRACPADERQEQRAWVLEGLAFCHVETEDWSAARAIVGDLLSGTWPEAALGARLNTALVVLSRCAPPDEETSRLVARAVDLGEAGVDDECRALMAELLKLQAWLFEPADLGRSRELLSRVVQEFSDVDDPLDSAADRLDDPYFRGRELLEQEGAVAAAEAAFREAVADGQEFAWLELAVVLAWQPGREDEEERALRAALDAQGDPERLAAAGRRLGCLLLYVKGDRAGAREAFGRASTGSGEDATRAVQELAVIAALERDHKARRQLVAELAGRTLEQFDGEEARRKDYVVGRTISRLGYARPFIAIRAWQWRRARRRAVREHGSTPGAR